MIHQLNSPAKSSLSKQYYFQLLPVELIFKKPQVTHPEVEPARMHNYKLTIHKGIQKFDQTRVPLSVFCGSKDASIKFDKSHMLSFYLPIFNANRQVNFTFKVHSDPKKQRQYQEVGAYDIDSNAFVNEVIENGVKMHERTIDLSDELAFSFELYIEHTRIELQKLLKNKHPEFYYAQNQSDKSDELSNSSRGKVVSAFGSKEAMVSPKKYLNRKQEQSEGQRKLLTNNSSQEDIQISVRDGEPRRSQKFVSSKIQQPTGIKLDQNNPVAQSEILESSTDRNVYGRSKNPPLANKYQRTSKNASFNSNVSSEKPNSTDLQQESAKEMTFEEKMAAKYSSYTRKPTYAKRIEPDIKNSLVQQQKPSSQENVSIYDKRKAVSSIVPEPTKPQEETVENKVQEIVSQPVQQQPQKEEVVEEKKPAEQEKQPLIQEEKQPEESQPNQPEESQEKQPQNEVVEEVQKPEQPADPVDQVSIQDTVGTQFRQEPVQERVTQREQYHHHHHHHSYSVHGDSPQVLEVGINEPAYQVRPIQEDRQENNNNSELETNTHDNRQEQASDDFANEVRSEVQGNQTNEHHAFRKHISIEANASSRDHDEEIESLDREMMENNKINQSYPEETYQQKVEDIINSNQEAQSANLPKQLTGSEEQIFQKRTGVLNKVQSFKHDDAEFTINVNLSSKNIPEQQITEEHHEEQKHEEPRQEPRQQMEQNEQPRPHEVAMQQSVTFRDDYPKKPEEQRREVTPIVEEQQIIIQPKTEQPERQLIDNNVEDKIIINEAESANRENPILVNTDDVLSAEERKNIENMTFEGEESPVKIENEKEREEYEELLRRSNDLADLKKKQEEQEKEEEGSAKVLSRTDSETFLTKDQVRKIEKEMAEKARRQFGIGSAIILVFLIVLSYFYLTLDGTKYTGRRTIRRKA